MGSFKFQNMAKTSHVIITQTTCGMEKNRPGLKSPESSNLACTTNKIKEDMSEGDMFPNNMKKFPEIYNTNVQCHVHYIVNHHMEKGGEEGKGGARREKEGDGGGRGGEEGGSAYLLHCHSVIAVI